MYNLKEASKDFIAKAAFLAKDLEYPYDEKLSEQRVDKWRECTMDISTRRDKETTVIK